MKNILNLKYAYFCIKYKKVGGGVFAPSKDDSQIWGRPIRRLQHEVRKDRVGGFADPKLKRINLGSVNLLMPSSPTESKP